jgi:hypothetical protein
MNYIVKNQELERAESYLKNLSNHLKETYEERGKYLFVGRLSYLMIAEVFVSFLLLGVMIAKTVPLVITTVLLFFTIYFFTGLALYGENILEKAKLPIISKKRFLKNFLKRNSLYLQPDLDSLNLTFYDLVIDDANLEIRLNYSRPWFKNTKR